MMDISSVNASASAREQSSGGSSIMQRHGPSCLTGPVSGRTGKAFPAAPVDRKDGSVPAPSPKPPLTQVERKERIERIRREIAAGDYDTPEKFTFALDLLIRRLEQD
jgi:hypothetical protein